MFISDAIEAIVGYPASDFSANGNRTFTSVIHLNDGNLVDQIVDSAVREHQPFSLEYRLIYADGSIRWIDVMLATFVFISRQLYCIVPSPLNRSG